MSGALPLAVLLALLLAGCATPGETAARRAWQQIERTEGPAPRAVMPLADPLLDGSLSAYLHYALRHSPALAASFEEWKASLETIPQARALPDPEVSFGYFVSQIDTRADPRGEVYGLMQMFPWFGKLKLRGDVALQSALASQQRFEAERLRVLERVAAAYYEYYYLHRAIRVTQSNLQLANHLGEIARARFRTDAGAHQDVIRAQVELGRVDEQLRALRDLEGPVQASLNAALGRPAETSLPPPPGQQELIFEPGLLGGPDHSWIERAHEANPELQALEHEVSGREQSLRLARRNYVPDFRLGVEYSRNAEARMATMDRGGTDMLMGTVVLNLPIWPEKYSAAIRESRALLEAGSRQLEERRLRLEAELKQALYGVRDAERKVDLYAHTLLPLARQSLQVLETGYRTATARTSFLDVIEAQRVLLEFELAHERALADRFQRLAEAERLLGGPIQGHAQPGSVQPRNEGLEHN